MKEIFLRCWRLCGNFGETVEKFWERFKEILEKIFYEGCSKSKVSYFWLFFKGNTEIHYQGENVQEICTTTL